MFVTYSIFSLKHIIEGGDGALWPPRVQKTSFDHWLEDHGGCTWHPINPCSPTKEEANNITPKHKRRQGGSTYIFTKQLLCGLEPSGCNKHISPRRHRRTHGRIFSKGSRDAQRANQTGNKKIQPSLPFPQLSQVVRTGDKLPSLMNSLGSAFQH